MKGKRFNPKDKRGSFGVRFNHYCKTVIFRAAHNLVHKQARYLIRQWGYCKEEADPEEMCREDEYEELYSVTLPVRGKKVLISSERLADMLMGLQERKREILIMSFFMDMSLEEIAKELGVRYETVKSTKSKAIRELRKGAGDGDGKS